jgi:hypothetical protein
MRVWRVPITRCIHETQYDLLAVERWQGARPYVNGPPVETGDRPYRVRPTERRRQPSVD